MCDRLGLQATTCLGKYPGFPLKHKGAPMRQFNYIAERVMNKLAGWKAKFLTFAGRAVLVKSVMSTIPEHVMQGLALPVHLYDKLNKINRDFLWGSTAEKRRMHMMGWDKLVKPKEEGGLGIQSTRAKDITLLTKLNWRMYHKNEVVWARVILQKHCSNFRSKAMNPDLLLCSPNWAAIKLWFPTFSNGIYWDLGKESKRNFLMDRWIGGQSLRKLIEGPLTREEGNLTVSDVRIGQD